MKNDYNSTIIFTSHNLHNVLFVADRIILINNGTIALDGPTQKILSQESGIRKVRIEANQKDDFNNEKLMNSFEKIEINGPLIKFETTKKQLSKDLKLALELIPIQDIKVVEPPLEEIFEAYYK